MFAHLTKPPEINRLSHMHKCLQNLIVYPVGTTSQMQIPVAVNLTFTITHNSRLYLNKNRLFHFAKDTSFSVTSFPDYSKAKRCEIVISISKLICTGTGHKHF